MWPFTKKKKKEVKPTSSRIVRTGNTFSMEDDPEYIDPVITGLAAAYIAEEISTPSYEEESFSGFGGGSFGGAGAGADFDTSSSSSDYSCGSDSSCDSSCD